MKEKIKILITSIILSAIIIVGFSYAFFEMTVNNDNHAIAELNTKKFSINFVDGADISLLDIIPGQTLIKTFTVENTGTETSYYTIYINDVINELKYKNDVVYSITGPSNKEETAFPIADAVLLENIEIPANEKHEYTMTIKYLNQEYDQTEDMDKYITGTIQIKEGLKKYNINGIAYDNDGNLITNGYAEVHSDVQRVPIDENGHFLFLGVPVGEHTITFFNHDEEEIKSQQFELVRTKLDNNKVEDKTVGGGKEINTISLLFDVKDEEIDIQLMPPSYTLNIITNNGVSSRNNVEMFEGRNSEVINLIPNEHYGFNNVTCTNNQTPIYENGSLYIENPTDNTTCTVEFEASDYTIYFETDGNGSTNISNTSVKYTENATATIIPNTGYHYENISCTNNQTASVSDDIITVSNVSSDTTCTITFAINTYTVRFISGDTSMGTISDSSVTVNHNSTATTTIEQNTGYHYDNIVCTNEKEAIVLDNTINVNNITSDTTCTVNFKINNYNVSFALNDSSYGTLSTTNNLVNHGQSTVTTVTPKTGYHYASVSCTNNQNASYNNGIITVSNITSDTTCTISLAINTYTVSFVSNNTNYGTVADASKTVNHGSSTSTTITPKTGYHYANLSCTGGSVSGSTVTVSNVTGNITCTVNFAINTYTVSFVSNNTNYGTLSSSGTTVNHGQSTVTTATPKTGYHYASVSCTNGQTATYSNGIITAANLTNNTTCTVNFAINTYSVQLKVSNGTGATTKTVNYNSTITFSSSPNSEYKYGSISCTNSQTASYSGTTVTTGKITNNTVCTLTYVENCAYANGTYWNFDYTGGEQTLNIPCSGTYKLEVWGAQGGSYTYNSTTYNGGYGAYSYGSTSLSKGNKLYINVGGQGKSKSGPMCVAAGGYNGGGYGYGSHWESHTNSYTSGGGGATHIATISGQLPTLSSKLSNIYIIAGGGGGYYYDGDAIQYRTVTASNGGGISSSIATSYVGSTTLQSGSIGANQSTGYAFGQGIGKSSTWTSEIAGGGGGLYGGDMSSAYSGGGGSGYIGNTNLTTKAMYCYNCATSSATATKTVSNTCVNSSPSANCSKTGNGYAKITLVSLK